MMFDRTANVRPKTKKRLASGQTVEFSAQDEKMLRAAYDYMQGFAKRRLFDQKLSTVGDELEKFESSVSIRIRERCSIVSPEKSNKRTGSAVAVVGATPSLLDVYSGDLSAEEESLLEELNRHKAESSALEEKYAEFLRIDQSISMKDVETLMHVLGVSPSKQVIQHMIYEVDEMVDEMVSWDEFLLTYYRNVTDISGCEPCSFFRIMEFVVFDPHHKGRIVEDDVMEVLFARIGAARLEDELQAIFGNNRRAKGGDGTISLQQYLDACLVKNGRRSLVC